MNANKSLTILLVVATVLAVSSLLVFKLVDKNIKPEVIEEEGSETVIDEVSNENIDYDIPMELRSSSIEWVKGAQYDIEIVFNSVPLPAPNALTLQVLFDPNVIEIIDVLPGNLWDETNMLQKTINNETGEVLTSIGQGFDTNPTGNLTAITLKAAVFSDADVNQTAVRLGPGSVQASVGVEELIEISETSITINIK